MSSFAPRLINTDRSGWHAVRVRPQIGKSTIAMDLTVAPFSPALIKRFPLFAPLPTCPRVFFRPGAAIGEIAK
jgi:hypothetical protein